MNPVIAWKEKNIIRLDDHQIVLDGFTNWCRRECPELRIRNYNDSDEVFSLIISSLFKDEKIDLFITDYAHPGLNGYEMCKAIRAVERAINRQQMPILLLTLYDKDTVPIRKGLADGTFTGYCSLGEDIELLSKIITDLVSHD